MVGDGLACAVLGGANPADVGVTAKFAASLIAISGGFLGFEGGLLGYSFMYDIGLARPACASVRGASGLCSDDELSTRCTGAGFAG